MPRPPRTPAAIQIRPRTFITDRDRSLRRHPALRSNLGIAFLLTFLAFCIAALALS
jgi:hypothetical protein